MALAPRALHTDVGIEEGACRISMRAVVGSRELGVAEGWASVHRSFSTALPRHSLSP